MFRRVVALTMSLKLYLLLCTTIFFFTTTFATTNNAAHPSSYGEESCLLSGSNDIESIAERREVYGQGRIFDITHRYTPEVPMFGSADGIGDEFIRLRWSMKNGFRSNSSYMKMSVHTGTHVDAPSHFVDRYYDAGFDVDAFDLEVLNGPALVVDVPRDKNITADVMKSLPIPKGVMRVMFRTVNTDRRLMYKKAFDTSFVGFMTDGAQWLVDNTDIKLVGIDYLSIAAYDDLVPAHVALMEQKIIVVEGVKLDDVPAGIYDVHCLALRLPRAEGSPIRCNLIK